MKWLLLVVLMIAISANYVIANMHDPVAEKVWNEVVKDAAYKKWKNWPDHAGMQCGLSSPHGELHIVYVNDVGLSKRGTPKPYGTVVVKEDYTQDRKLDAITVMYKVPGYNPDAADWFWARYTADGKAGPVGTPEGCISCHMERSGRDFIIVSQY
ncbi:cytochrome P460 family protein [Desulfovibrio mangrovi]|uniref:cytochrome P460 family protein n=1 Tax=Desulfovibrio mangrovi TaxID=2976983 RepID=UPI0022482A2A|nr:cytochrome P460 family protein [Desulfovibrio mangrovi]UZP67205.1 cytochrome P460 family protein [Desulfovibrio mangrovi]